MVFNNNLLLGAAGAAGGYTIDQSARFNDGDSPELSRTYTLSAPWTFSAWVKRCELGAVNILLGTSGSSPEIQFNSGDTITAEALTTTAVFRDPASWYHIHVSDNGLYINGTSFGAVTTTSLTNAKLFDDFDGYVAEVHLQSGTSAYTNFGETNLDTGQWVPKAATAGDTYLKFANSSDFGENSGTGGAWTASGLTSADQVSDTPTDNFCTWNPLRKGPAHTLSDGNLVINSTLADATFGTFMVSSGKWYWEITALSGELIFGIADENAPPAAAFDTASAINTRGYNGFNGQKTNNGSGSAYGATFTTNDVIGVALNMDDGEITFYKNNVSQGVAFTGLTGFWGPGASVGNTLSCRANFGQTGGFTYTPPTGFNALSTANLPDPAIADPTAYFQTTLYTGNGTAIGSGGNAVSQIENSTFQPDFVWIKRRDSAVEHALTDAVRGVTKELSSNDTGAEETVAEGLTSFGSAGFTVGSDGSYNTNTGAYVAWQWKANGTGSSNTDGTISSTVSADTTSGFSIIRWSGTGANGTIGHGLGIQPSLYIVKNTATTNSWLVGSTLYSNTQFLILNATDALDTAATIWNSAYPTSSVINLGSNVGSNGSGTNNMICYAFAEIEGFSKFGSIEGNGNANGSFGFLGFRPALVILKSIDSTSDWHFYDNQRAGYNVANYRLEANSTDAETTTAEIDLLSNGFKLRTATDPNVAETYIYAAFAESPFKTANAR